jgi:putative FmdB family regulatory protein
MPIYEYRCKECGEKFEAFRSIHDKDNSVECPRCGRKGPRRIPSSVFSSIPSGNHGNLRLPT